MIKECKVILHNDKVAVVMFDKTKVQVPNSELIGKTAFVRFENGKYSIVSKEEFIKYNNKKNRNIKKNDNEKSIENEVASFGEDTKYKDELNS